MGRSIAILAIAACLAVTGCGYPKLEKPEKAFCKAENRVIPDDELMARALLAMRKVGESGNYRGDLPIEMENHLTQNLPAKASDRQVNIALRQYVKDHPNLLSFEYNPHGPDGLLDGRLVWGEYPTEDKIYYNDLLIWVKSDPDFIKKNGLYTSYEAAAVSTCGKILIYSRG